CGPAIWRSSAGPRGTDGRAGMTGAIRAALAALGDRSDQVKYVERDFPLDRSCNQSVGRTLHTAACNAAVAMRLSAEQHREDSMREWLFAHQAEMTSESVAFAASIEGHVIDFDAKREGTLQSVRRDISDGAALKVTGTPTMFIDGVRFAGSL